MVICKVSDCQSLVVARGMCDKHYRRWRKFGDPHKTKRPDDWGERTKHPLYKLWHGMIRRCESKKHKDYHNYGARGIRVCKRWHDFWLFLDDMGARPSREHSIDRIDNMGNYTPQNCRWATAADQARNTRVSVITAESAAEIKRRMALGEKTGDIARAIGLEYDQVRNVVVGNSWSES